MINLSKYLLLVIITIASSYMLSGYINDNNFDKNKKGDIKKLLSINNEECYKRAMEGNNYCESKHENYIFKIKEVRSLEYNLKTEKKIDNLFYITKYEYWLIFFSDKIDSYINKGITESNFFAIFLTFFILIFIDFKSFVNASLAKFFTPSSSISLISLNKAE